MARYIDADLLEAALFTPHIYDINRDDVIALVAEQPTADVKEVKHGHWKHCEEPLGWQEVDVAVCSVCGGEWVLDEWDIDDFAQWNKFCPCCGAKMDGRK